MNTQKTNAVTSIVTNATRSVKPRLELPLPLALVEVLGDFFMADKAMRMYAASASPQDRK